MELLYYIDLTYLQELVFPCRTMVLVPVLNLNLVASMLPVAVLRLNVRTCIYRYVLNSLHKKIWISEILLPWRMGDQDPTGSTSSNSNSISIIFSIATSNSNLHVLNLVFVHVHVGSYTFSSAHKPLEYMYFVEITLKYINTRILQNSIQ